jgi:hypothetical protein
MLFRDGGRGTATEYFHRRHLSHPRRRQLFLFHLTAHHFTGRRPNLVPPASLATEDANKNLDDVMCIPCAMDVATIWNRTSFTPFFHLLLYNPLLLLCFLFFFANCYRITTVIYISRLSSLCRVGACSKFLTVGPVRPAGSIQAPHAR